MQAENEAETLHSWTALYKSYRLYARCDDGAAAEGYSESVARILVDHWKTLPRLDQLSRRDKSFRDFVLHHVDATLDTDDVGKIRANALQHCPEGLPNLCKNLLQQADAAINEYPSVDQPKLKPQL